MPVAPNAMAFSACSGVSALVRTPSLRELRPHQFISLAKFLIGRALLRDRATPSTSTWTISDGAVLTSPAKHFAGRAVDGEEIAFLERRAARRVSVPSW